MLKLLQSVAEQSAIDVHKKYVVWETEAEDLGTFVSALGKHGYAESEYVVEVEYSRRGML